MARRSGQQLWTEAACYHVMNRGHNREKLLAHDEDRRYFLDLLRRYRLRFGFRLYHYCLMDNHFHLLLQLTDPKLLSSLMAGLLRSFVHYFNRRYGFVGHLWQGRFKSPAIEAETYALSCGRYIERNPLAAGLVQWPWEYRWSSCRAYVLGEANDLLAENPWYLQMAKPAERRQELWRSFLMDEDPKEEAIRDADWLTGDDDFRRRSRTMRSRPIGKGRGRPMQKRRD